MPTKTLNQVVWHEAVEERSRGRMESWKWKYGALVWISRGIDLANQLFFPVFYLHYLFFKYGEWFRDFFTGINKFPDLTSPYLEKSKLGFP